MAKRVQVKTTQLQLAQLPGNHELLKFQVLDIGLWQCDNFQHKVSYLLEHFLSRIEFMVVFLQGAFQIPDLFSLSFNLVSKDAHLKTADKRSFR